MAFLDWLKKVWKVGVGIALGWGLSIIWSKLFTKTSNSSIKDVENPEELEDEGRVSEQCPAVNEAEPIRNPADLEERREQNNDDKDPPEPSQPLPPRKPNLQISGGNYNQTAIMSEYTSYNSTSGSIQDGPNQQNPNDN
uniref:uncharacterized protein LOC120326280 n=1 Tax=Styela clava TaxID=7725 RepID=UPI00193989D6|nr:uncharacterized protein LOC120326280 [Styela clava]